MHLITRRLLTTAALLPASLLVPPRSAHADEKFAYQPALQGKDYGKSAMDYSDFSRTPNGLLFKEGKAGTGKTPEIGDRVVVEWTGYTIGYFGRPFETKQLKELDKIEDAFLRFKVGDGTVVPGINEGVLGMAEGGVRQLVVKPEIGYPKDDPKHERVGPKPSTFSGQRALDFVLENQELIDKTLLFNVKLIRVDKPGDTSRVDPALAGKSAKDQSDFAGIKFDKGDVSDGPTAARKGLNDASDFAGIKFK